LQGRNDIELIPFIRGKIQLYQRKKGYRFSIDSVLLADFVRIKRRGKLIDLGTGSGIIILLLALRYKNLEFHAVELQESLFEIAKENFMLNNVKVKLILGDVKSIKEFYEPNSFDYVVTNPPFHRVSIKEYTNEEIEIAKSERKASLEDFVKAAAYLLKSKGRLFIIVPSNRLSEAVLILDKYGLYIKRLRFIYPSIEDSATHFLVESLKDSKLGGEIVEKPLILYKEKRNKSYTEELERILNVFS